MSKKAALKQRGEVAFAKQIREAGGTYTTDEVSQLLDMTIVEILEQTGSELLCVRLQGGDSYPCWQFYGNRIVNNFSEVMAMLHTHSTVGIVQFFLTKDEILNKSPIDVLRSVTHKELAIVKVHAKQFYQQIAR